MRVAIYPDDYTDPVQGKPDASSPRWAQLLADAGHEVMWVDVTRPDILTQVAECEGFMWRHIHMPRHRQIARRLLPVLEQELGLAVYPDQATCWHYDDKIAQYYLLRAAGVPMPDTWVWFDQGQALDWVERASFPLVIKLWTGAASQNVRLVPDRRSAQNWIKRLFTTGVGHLDEKLLYPVPPWLLRLWNGVQFIAKGRAPYRPWELHKGYVYLQEFLPDNPYDTRVWVIGNRAFAIRRYNRPDDFRASGSGRVEWDPGLIDMDAVTLAFDVAQRLRLSSVNLDIMRRKGEFVVGEISYTAVSWCFYECPGHWERDQQQIRWVPGHMWPEQAQIEDFLVRLENRCRRAHS